MTPEAVTEFVNRYVVNRDENRAPIDLGVEAAALLAAEFERALERAHARAEKAECERDEALPGGTFSCPVCGLGYPHSLASLREYARRNAPPGEDPSLSGLSIGLVHQELRANPSPIYTRAMRCVRLHEMADRITELERQHDEAKARAERAEAALKAHQQQRFPVMIDYEAGFSIPWSVVEPFERQAQLNHGGQTLKRLAERGGLSPRELWHVVNARPWKFMSPHPDCPSEADCRAWALGLARG